MKKKKKTLSTKSTVDGSWHIFGSRTQIKYALQVNPPTIRSSFMYVKQRNENSLSFILFVVHLSKSLNLNISWRTTLSQKRKCAFKCVSMCGTLFPAEIESTWQGNYNISFFLLSGQIKKRNCIYFKPFVINSSQNRVIKSPAYSLTGGRWSLPPHSFLRFYTWELNLKQKSSP